jgi:hypothetical protein
MAGVTSQGACLAGASIATGDGSGQSVSGDVIHARGAAEGGVLCRRGEARRGGGGWIV